MNPYIKQALKKIDNKDVYKYVIDYLKTVNQFTYEDLKTHLKSKYVIYDYHMDRVDAYLKKLIKRKAIYVSAGFYCTTSAVKHLVD